MAKNILCFSISLFFLIGISSPLKAEVSKCEECHIKVSPKQVEDFKRGGMAKSLDCTDCHGTDHQSEADVDKAQLPAIATCQGCHEEQAEQYLSGKHALGLVALEAMPIPTCSQKPLSRGKKDVVDATPWA